MLTTALVGDSTSKTDVRIAFFGTVDELSAFLMELRHHFDDENLKKDIIQIVQNLSIMMGVVAGGKSDFGESKLNEILKLNNRYIILTGKLTSFVLPGISYLSSKIHIVRTVARRAELAYARVYEKYGGNNYIFEYLNKLSTFLYNLALYYEEK